MILTKNGLRRLIRQTIKEGEENKMSLSEGFPIVNGFVKYMKKTELFLIDDTFEMNIDRITEKTPKIKYKRDINYMDGINNIIKELWMSIIYEYNFEDGDQDTHYIFVTFDYKMISDYSKATSSLKDQKAITLAFSSKDNGLTWEKYPS